MSNEISEQNFFDDAGEYVPTALLKGIGDVVKGVVVDTRIRDHIPFGKKEPEVVDGKTRKELVITLQTENRNWANVVKVPKVDPDDPNSPDRPGSDDEGLRNIYLPQRSNIQSAVGRAMRSSKVKSLSVGDKLGVKIVNLKDVNKGNPLKEHEAFHAPAPQGSGNFFDESAKPAQPEQAKPTEQPKPAEAPKADPWANQGSEIPF